jgi:hypothetical protein
MSKTATKILKKFARRLFFFDIGMLCFESQQHAVGLMSWSVRLFKALKKRGLG